VSKTAHIHAWATAWSKNDTHHWHECTADGCGVTDNAQKDGYAAHAKTWVKTDAAQHWQTCAACGWTGEKTAHVYESDQDAECNTCGYTRTVAPPTPTPPGTGFSENYYTLTATAGEGGSISPQGKVTVQQGLRKTFTVTPDEGWEIADVLVDGKSVGAVESYVFRQVMRRHTIEATFRSMEEKNDREENSLPFTDVPRGAWYYDSVKDTYKAGLMDGTGDGLFSPETVTSRAMIAAILWRLESSPESKAPVRFPDCEKDTWYASGVAWASEAGVVKGYDTGSFGPDDPITREQLAVMLYRYAQTKGKGFVGSWMFRLDFADAAEVSSWASEAVHWCVMNQLLTGKDGNRLDPQGLASRAEAAMLTHFLE